MRSHLNVADVVGPEVVKDAVIEVENDEEVGKEVTEIEKTEKEIVIVIEIKNEGVIEIMIPNVVVIVVAVEVDQEEGVAAVNDVIGITVVMPVRKEHHQKKDQRMQEELLHKNH